MARVAFARFKSDVLAVYEPPLRAKKTYFQVRQVLDEFSKVPGVKWSSDLTPRAIAAWIKEYPDRSPIRTQSLLSTLHACCAYGIASGMLPKDPFVFRGVKEWVRNDVIAPPTQKSQSHRSPAEIKHLLDMLAGEASRGGWKEGRLYALVGVYAFLGLRKNEALHLRTWDVDLKSRTLAIQPQKDWRPKTSRSAAMLPIVDPLAEILELWLPRTGCDWVFPGVRLKGPWLEGMTGTKPLDQVKLAGERAGIKGLTILSFRKTIGTYAKAWGLSPIELMKILRHTDVHTQKYYIEDDLELLHASARKIKFA